MSAARAWDFRGHAIERFRERHCSHLTTQQAARFLAALASEAVLLSRSPDGDWWRIAERCVMVARGRTVVTVLPETDLRVRGREGRA